MGILAVKASWIIYFAMLLSSCSEIRVNQIADWMEKQEEVKFFFKYCKRQPHTVEQCIYHSLDIKYIVLCSTPVISAARQKCTFFVTTDACAVNWKLYIDLKFITNELNQRHILLCHGVH